MVVCPAVRGRSQKNSQGKNYGKAPACIVDLKAAVRFLHHFSDVLPGNQENIISNGTSGGGALSALLGAGGNSADYETYLEEIGAYKGRDDIFAASCYCPITNLENADMAYEWQFQKEHEYHRICMQMDEGGRPEFTLEDGFLDEQRVKISKEEAELFPAYVNSLNLMENERKLELDAKGEGSFKEYVKSFVMQSAQKALDEGENLSEKNWLSIKDKKIVSMDFDGYIKDITRMKTAPAFDDVSMDSPENNLFGTQTEESRHFTSYSDKNSLVQGKMAEKLIIKMMNPMSYIDDDRSTVAKNWRIRHGAADRDTSLAIPVILANKLKEKGSNVDFHLPWNTSHGGDYDLPQLFEWIDGLVKRVQKQ